MLTGVDPDGIARTVYLVVIWNCALFLAAMYCVERLPPLPAHLDPELKLVARAFTWVGLWAVGAVLLAWFRDDLPPAWWLFGTALVVASLYIRTRWRDGPLPSHPTLAGMWRNWRGFVRIACFVVVFCLLSAVAYVAHSARWVGWASALPLPGIFALATLSVSEKKEDMLALGDTLLLGPLLVIPFNWLLVQAIAGLRLGDAGTPAEIGVVVAFWTVAAALVFAVVPPFARWRDRR
jgi:hypothetical protein